MTSKASAADMLSSRQWFPSHLWSWNRVTMCWCLFRCWWLLLLLLLCSLVALDAAMQRNKSHRAETTNGSKTVSENQSSTPHDSLDVSIDSVQPRISVAMSAVECALQKLSFFVVIIIIEVSESGCGCGCGCGWGIWHHIRMDLFRSEIQIQIQIERRRLGQNTLRWLLHKTIYRHQYWVALFFAIDMHCNTHVGKGISASQVKSGGRFLLVCCIVDHGQVKE